MEDRNEKKEDRNEKILENADELASYTSFEFYERILDEMLLSYLEGDSEEKSSAYFFVMNLKRLLKVTCENYKEILKADLVKQMRQQ